MAWYPAVLEVYKKLTLKPRHTVCSEDAQAHENTTNVLINEWLGNQAMQMAGSVVYGNAPITTAALVKLDKLTRALNAQSPEAITSLILSDWCGDKRAIGNTQQRYASVWNSILTPMVASREHSNKQLCSQDLFAAGKDWLTKSGHTEFSLYCANHLVIRKLGTHSPRAYQLVFDSALAANESPARLAASLVLPIMQPLLVAMTLSEQQTFTTNKAAEL